MTKQAYKRTHTETLGQYVNDKGQTITRALKIDTYKNESRKCLMSTATVVSIDPDNPTWFTYAVYQDYFDRLAMNSDRATTKNIDALHQGSIDQLPTVRQCARAHYRDWI